MNWIQAHARGAMLEARNLSLCASATRDAGHVTMWNDKAARMLYRLGGMMGE